jgi:protoporphyrinogen oxidase
MNDPGRIIILGAGPTGLGAAYRLQELGFTDFIVLEAEAGAGGLASSSVDEAGFTWDLGGHVGFSHYAYYDRILERAIGLGWLYHDRQSWVWMKDRFIPYPFQNNIHRLEPPDRELAWEGMKAAASRRQIQEPNLKQWIVQTFGEGVADLFLYPYNWKVWGYPLETLSSGWVGERVSVPDLERIARNIKNQQDDLSWGPNQRFCYPLRGGTGSIWEKVSGLIKGDFRYKCRVNSVDLVAHDLVAGGNRLHYDVLISTIPLDVLCALSGGPSPQSHKFAAKLVYSSVHIIGIGLARNRPEHLSSKSWIYFPEFTSPYYRVTVLSNYSPYNVPDPERHWSLMAEVSETPAKPVRVERLIEETVAAMKQDFLIPAGAQIVDTWHRRLEHGFPTPSLERDHALQHLLPAFETHRVFSRGRFGGWKYEVSNQDHSLMQGVELVNRLLLGEPEVTFHHPDIINSGKYL